MKLQGSHIFQHSLDEVWEALMDPGVLSLALPGGEALQQVGPNEYSAVMNMRVGPVQGRFEGGIELSDIDPKKGYRMQVKGQGAPGFLSGEGALRLAEVDEGVELTYTGDVQVGGKIAGLSQRLVESTARSVIKQGLAALDTQIAVSKAPQDLLIPPTAPRSVTLEAKEMVSEGGPIVLPEEEPVARDAAMPGWEPVASREPRPLASRATGARPAGARPAGASGTGQERESSTLDGSFARNVIVDVVTDFASDFIPRRHQEKALWAAIGAVGAFLFVALVRLAQKR